MLFEFPLEGDSRAEYLMPHTILPWAPWLKKSKILLIPSDDKYDLISQSLYNLTGLADHFYQHLLLLHGANWAHLSLHSSPVLVSYSPVCLGTLCDVYLLYLSDTMCVCWVFSDTLLGVFLYDLLKISHCSLGKHPVA